MRKFLFFVALVVFIVSAVQVGRFFIEPRMHQRQTNELVEIFRNTAPETEDGWNTGEMNPRFAELFELNPDIIGWIEIPGAGVDYPVVKGEDNSFYLRRDFYRNNANAGSIFADYNASIAFGEESQNVTLYGHNMRLGNKFGQLNRYEDLDFFKENPTIRFDTLFRDGYYKIFSVFIGNALPGQDNGNFFNWAIADFYDTYEFADWISGARERSLFNIDVEVRDTDEILTLQTCNDAFGRRNGGDRQARLIVMARRVRRGESPRVDTSTAEVNPNPRFPQVWYDVRNRTNPWRDVTTTTAPVTTE